MNAEQELRRYVRPAAWQRIAAWVLLALAVVAIVPGVEAGGRDDTVEAVEFYPSETETGAYAYIDIIGLTDWCYQSDDIIYYTAIDVEFYRYTVRLSKSQFAELKAYNDWWNDEDPNAVPPEPRRLYGMARQTSAETAEAMAQVWDLAGEQAYYDAFGTLFLNATTSPSSESGAMWILLAVFSFIMGLCLLAICAAPLWHAKKCFQRLEGLGLLPDAAAEFAAPDTLQLNYGRTRLSSRFAFSKGMGVAVRYEDILWCYRRTIRYYFVAVAETLVINTADGKNLVLVNAGRSRRELADPIDHCMQLIAERNPEALLGYTRENAKAYKERAKALR